MAHAKVAETLVFSNFCVACFDDAGQQIAELQRSLIGLWAEHAERMGYNPDGWIITDRINRWRIFRCESGWNFEHLG